MSEVLVKDENRWLRHFSKFVCGMTLCLIFFGGQVKSHEAGLAVPDWPLTFGHNPITYPPSNWVGGIFHEHFHRLFAGFVAALTVILAIWLAFKTPQRWLKWAGGLAVLAVLLQALLGGLTVLFQLPTAVSSMHALLAQTFLVILVVIAYGLSKERIQRINEPADEGGNFHLTPLLRGSWVIIGVVYLQLFLGAIMRHTGSGLAIPDFPTVAGRWLPFFNQSALQWVNDWRFEHQAYAIGMPMADVTLLQMWIHFSHRLGALLVLIAVLYMVWRAQREDELPARIWQSIALLFVLVAVQFSLGLFTLWTLKQPVITSLHVVTGAGILASSVLLTLRIRPILSRDDLTKSEIDDATTLHYPKSMAAE